MDSTQRFTGKAGYYKKYRPSYALSAMEYMKSKIGMAFATVADIGAGTGIFTKQLSDFAGHVYAVEPNSDMRSEAENYLSDASNVTVLSGKAEKTGLSVRSVDFVTAAEAFHWFDMENCKKEFARILKPAGKVVLIWNSRKGNYPFREDMNALYKRFNPTYNDVRHDNITEEEFNSFFNGSFEREEFINPQAYTLEQFTGQAISNSNAPLEGSQQFAEFKNAIAAIFNQYSTDERINFSFTTTVISGRV